MFELYYTLGLSAAERTKCLHSHGSGPDVCRESSTAEPRCWLNICQISDGNGSWARPGAGELRKVFTESGIKAFQFVDNVYDSDFILCGHVTIV